MTKNIVEAILDRKKLKWDAFWHFFGWLLDEEEGHGLGSGVVDELFLYAFGQHFPSPKIHLEFQLSDIKDGKGKWPDLVVAVPSFEKPTHIILMDDVDKRSPGANRKLDNLIAYRSIASAIFPSAKIRVIVLTNAQNGDSMPKLYQALEEEAEDFNIDVGWRLLSISEVGDWVQSCLKSSGSSIDRKIQLFLQDFVAWSKSLHT